MARILLADDDEKLRETLAEALRAEGWDVLTANNGANAQQVWDDAAAGGDTPKVVVLDALMPKVSGFDAAKGIKAKDPEAAFIFMTGVFKSAAQQQDAKDKFDCKAYLVKPFDLAKLVEAVRPLMAVHEAAAAFQPAEPLPGEGTLLEAPVAYLLWRAEKEKHTGALDLFGTTDRARIFIYKGKAVFGQHSDPLINIGIELIKDGVLTAESYRQAVEMCVQRSTGIYDVIKNEGWATDQQMRPVYKRVVPKVIERVAAMNGRFRWTATDEFSSIVPAATVAIVDTLLNGIRRASEADLGPHVDPRRPLRLAPGGTWDQVVPLLQKGCGSDSLARAINGRATIAQMIEAAPSAEERASRLKQVYLLMSTMSVQASLDPIKMEGNHFIPSATAPAPEAPRPQPAASSAGSSGPAMGNSVLPKLGGNTPEDTAMDRAITFNAEEKAARERILGKIEEVKAAKDLFAVLGAPRGADAATVKRAYIALARDFHPDSFSGKNLGSAKHKLDDLYAAFTEANATLTDPKKRGEYDARISIEDKGGSTDVGAIFQADADFQKGKLICERGDYTAALKMFDKAFAVVKDNEELTGYRAYCQWWATRNADTATGVITQLEHCYVKVPIAHALKEFQGRVYMEIGNLAKAKACFKKVLEADSEHMGSSSAMRILQRKLDEEAKKPPPTGGGLGGMLGRLGNKR